MPLASAVIVTFKIFNLEFSFENIHHDAADRLTLTLSALAIILPLSFSYPEVLFPIVFTV